MGVLLEIPHPDYFTPILDISEAVSNYNLQSNIKTKLQSLAKIFVKHGVYNDFGLILIHRHFDLKPREIIVETISEDNVYSCAIPWEISDENVASPTEAQSFLKSISFKEKEFVVPQSWYFANDGNLQSYEFISDSNPLEKPPEPFVTELFKELAKLGCLAIFGLRKLGHLRFNRSWEISPKDARANLTKFTDELPTNLEGEEMNTVVWSFSANGDVQSVSGCSSSQSQVDELEGGRGSFTSYRRH